MSQSLILSFTVIIILITLWKVNSNLRDTIKESLEISLFFFFSINWGPALGGSEAKHWSFRNDVYLQGSFDSLTEEVVFALSSTLETLLNYTMAAMSAVGSPWRVRPTWAEVQEGFLEEGVWERALEPGQLVPVVILGKTMHSWKWGEGRAEGERTSQAGVGTSQRPVWGPRGLQQVEQRVGIWADGGVSHCRVPRSQAEEVTPELSR